MRGDRGFIPAALILCLTPALCAAQDLTPRAYLTAPVSANAVLITYAFADGELLFDPTLPIEDAVGTSHTPAVTAFATFNLLGRTSNISGSLPFAFGDFSGTVAGEHGAVRRSGVADIAVRFSVNLFGAPALVPREFVRTPLPRATIGASVKVIAPTGRYDPSVLINIGSNRWAIKPEVAYTRRAGPLTLDMYAGLWLFTANNNYYAARPGAPPSVLKQDPIGALEFHVSYDITPRLWISADINYWRGGRASVNGVKKNDTLQANSRFGVTGSVPITSHQSLKVSYSEGMVIRIGGNYRIVSIGWQYGWIGMPFSGP
jgi:Putative MetA-pathway of phenol degradation